MIPSDPPYQSTQTAAKGWHSRGYLPHFDGGEMAQSITIRLGDSMPKAIVQQWQDELKRLPTDKQIEQRHHLADRYLDRGAGACWLSDPRVAHIVEQALFRFDGSRYYLHAWVLMPNHAHILVTPLKGNHLANILHSWKSYTASRANSALGRKGRFWQQDYFDRLIRNEDHYMATVQYIENNPVKAGLCRTAGEWLFSSASLK